MSSRRHPILSAIASLCAIIAVLGCAARLFPEDLQALPFVPYIIALSPWYALLALVALICAIISRRWFVVFVSIGCIIAQGYWQLPYYQNGPALSSSALQAVSQVKPITDDTYARVMTCNVYRGAANAQQIVDLVRENHIEVLALQETTSPFVEELNKAGIQDVLPYSIIASSDHKYGNGIWSATPMQQPADAEFDSSASSMPAGTIRFDHGNMPIRFVSVHTTSPSTRSWSQWDKSLEEMQALSRRTGVEYVLMGDFNATTDHAVFRNLLGTRFQDATQTSGHGLLFTFNADQPYLPAFSGIDHILTEQGVTVGQVRSVKVEGSDHRALLATLDFTR